VNNPATGTRIMPGWGFFLICFIAALQVIQFILLGFLYFYIARVESRLDKTNSEHRQEIIQLLKRG